jgi:antitoxin VapB
MALNIKDPATDELARRLSAETGESITVAVRVALMERLGRRRTSRLADGGADELEAIIARGRARPAIDFRRAEEILGYDEHGLPR